MDGGPAGVGLQDALGLVFFEALSVSYVCVSLLFCFFARKSPEISPQMCVLCVVGSLGRWVRLTQCIIACMAGSFLEMGWKYHDRRRWVARMVFDAIGPDDGIFWLIYCLFSCLVYMESENSGRCVAWLLCIYLLLLMLAMIEFLVYMTFLFHDGCLGRRWWWCNACISFHD